MLPDETESESSPSLSPADCHDPTSPTLLEHGQEDGSRGEGGPEGGSKFGGEEICTALVTGRAPPQFRAQRRPPKLFAATAVVSLRGVPATDMRGACPVRQEFLQSPNQRAATRRGGVEAVGFTRVAGRVHAGLDRHDRNFCKLHLELLLRFRRVDC